MPAAEVRLVVSVKDARNFPLEWLNGNHRPYLQFVLPGAGRGSTAPWLGETQPQWKERFEFMVDPLNDQLALSVGLMDERRKEADATPVAHVAISIMEIFHTSKMQVKLGSAIYSSLADIFLVLNFDHCFPPAPPKSMIELIARSRAAGPLPLPEEREPVSSGSRSSHHVPPPDAHADGHSSRPRGREWESPALSPDQTERDRYGRRPPLVSAFPVRSPDRPPQLFLGDSLMGGPSDPAPWNDDWSVVDGHVPSVSDWPQAPLAEASKRAAPYQREEGRPLPESSLASPKLLKRALLRRHNIAIDSDTAHEVPYAEAFPSRERADSDSTKRSLSGGSRRARSAIVTDPPSTNRRTPSQERDRAAVQAEEVPRSPPARTRSAASRRPETSSSLPAPLASASTFRAASPPPLISPRSGQRTGTTNATSNPTAGLQPFSRGQVPAEGSGGLPRPPSWSVHKGSTRQASATDTTPSPVPTGTQPNDPYVSAINLLDPLSSARQTATATRVRRLGRAGGDANPPLP